MCFLICVCFLLQEPQPIDWEYYRKGIGSKVVDMYKEAYESKHPCKKNNFIPINLKGMSFG